MKVLFFGSSCYCLPVLEALNNHFKLISIVTKKDQAVEKYAQKHHVKTFTPKDKIELVSLISQIRRIQPDLAIVADYGLIIPPEIFKLPKHKTLNIHFSRLPDLRGPSPVQYTILRGDKSAWISIIIMDEGLDSGDIIWQKEIKLRSNQAIKLSSNETTESLYKKLFEIASLALPGIIKKYENNELKPRKQDHSKATYTKLLTREDGFIPLQILATAINCKAVTKKELWKWPFLKIISPQLPYFAGRQATTNDQLPIIIDRTICAFTPWPGVWTNIQITDNKKQKTKRLKILKAHIEQKTENRKQKTKLILDLVQLEGKNPVSWKQFREGYPYFSF